MTLSRREFLASLAGLATIATPSLARAALSPTDKFGIAGTVVAGDTSLPLPEHVVLINRGRIEAVVPMASVTDRPVLAPGVATILPGVINAHCHRVLNSKDRRSRWLNHGVTAIGDVGSPLSAMDALIDSPGTLTAAATCTGPVLAVPGGYPFPIHKPEHALAIHSSAEGENAVRMLADKGASMIKLAFEPGVMPHPWPTLDPKKAEAICATARKLGLTIRCHVEDLSGLEPALDAGVHTIEHVPHRWMHEGRPHPVLTERGEVIPYYRTLLERMRREGVILTPTLDVLSRTPWNGPELYEPVRTFHAMGGRIALGNDFPYRRTDAGMPVREMRLLAKAGLSGEDVLRAGTSGSASACGFTDRGHIAPGNAADILVVRGNPAEDFNVLHQPLYIFKDGVQL